MRQGFFLLILSIFCVGLPSPPVAQPSNQWEEKELNRFTTPFSHYDDRKVDIYSGYFFDEEFFVKNNDFMLNHNQLNKHEALKMSSFIKQNDGEKDQFPSTLGKWAPFFENGDFNPFGNGSNSCEVLRCLIEIGSANYKVICAIIERCGETQKVKRFTGTKKYKSGLADILHGSKPSDIFPSDAITSIVNMLLKIKKEAKEDGQEGEIEWAAIATAAMRDAENNKEVVREISRSTGIKVEIISQEKEGFLSYIGARQLIQETDPLIQNPMVWDAGGGSFQVSFIHQEAPGPYTKAPIYVYGGNIGTAAYLDFLKRLVVPKLPGHGNDFLPITTLESAQDVVQYVMGWSVHMIGFPLPKALIDQIKELQLFGVSRLHRYSVLPFIDPKGDSFTREQLTKTLIELTTLTKEEIFEKYPLVDHQKPESDIANAFFCLAIMNFLGKEKVTIVPLESSLQSAMVWSQLQWTSDNYLCPQWTQCSPNDSSPNQTFSFQRPKHKESCYNSCPQPQQMP